MEKIIRNERADLVIRDYYNGLIDMETMHNTLLRIFGDHKSAVTYLATVDETIKKEANGFVSDFNIMALLNSFDEFIAENNSTGDTKKDIDLYIASIHYDIVNDEDNVDDLEEEIAYYLDLYRA